MGFLGQQELARYTPITTWRICSFKSRVVIYDGLFGTWLPDKLSLSLNFGSLVFHPLWPMCPPNAFFYFLCFGLSGAGDYAFT